MRFLIHTGDTTFIDPFVSPTQAGTTAPLYRDRSKRCSLRANSRTNKPTTYEGIAGYWGGT
jgi:hypothetical protein